MASRGGADEDVAFEDAPIGEALVEASDERHSDTPGVGLGMSTFASSPSAEPVAGGAPARAPTISGAFFFRRASPRFSRMAVSACRVSSSIPITTLVSTLGSASTTSASLRTVAKTS